jgi:DNA-binding IclR family transcriptional regulator
MNTAGGYGGTDAVKAVSRTFRILEYIRTSGGATLQELDGELDPAKSTIYRHLVTLENHGFVVREDDTYHVGLRFLNLARAAKERKPAYDIIGQKVERLASETGERAQFITEENGLGIHVHIEVGENGIHSDTGAGTVDYLHTMSAGKSILAYYPRERVDEIVDRHGLPEETENTITDREELYEVLERVRERGYAFNRSERRDGMQAIGVPVLAPDGRVLGGLSVTGPLRRMQSEHESYLPDLLLDLTEDIRLRLEYSQ